MIPAATRLLPALLLGLAATASAQTTSPPGNPSTSPATNPPASSAARSAAAPKGAMDQSAALGVLSAINHAEIDAGKLAQDKAKSGPVREYAARMVKEHTQNDTQAQTWKPDPDAAPARAQKAKGQAELKQLSALDGDAFERAYVQAMVKDHTEALRMLDQKLIPAAEQAPVRAFLKETRAHVADHLAAAQRLQDGKKSAGQKADAAGHDGH